MPRKFKVIDNNDVNHVDPRRDVPDVKEIPVFLNKLIIEKAGPHGFHRIRYEHGVTPRDLQGRWMSQKEAENAIRRYFAKIGKENKLEGKL